MATIVKIREMVRRPPEQGRIRYGEKVAARSGKERPTAIETWRFTSPDRDSIEQLAAMYGGEAGPWFDQKASPQHQFSVTTTSKTISVFLPRDTYTLMYERWGGGGKERVCDGEVCTFYGRGRPMEGPCACANEPEQSCKPVSRLNVILPGVNFGGVWRLEAKGWNFAHEAPGMIDSIFNLQPDGMAQVQIMLTKRSKMEQGKVSHFMVPQLIVPMTPEQMLQGVSQVQRLALPSPQHPSVQQPARPQLVAVPDRDDEVVDAEVMDDEWQDWNDDRGDWGAWDTGRKDSADSAGESDARPSDELTRQLEASLRLVESQRAEKRAAKLAVNGWDERPPGIKVRRNPDPNGPTWIRR
jgi:hypothetical protein